MAHYEDLTIDQGTDVTIDIYLVNPDGTKKDLTGYFPAARMALGYDADSDSKIPFSAAVRSPSTDGIVNLSLTNEITAALKHKKRYVYDVEISKDSDGTTLVERVLEGLITVTPQVT